MAGFFEKFGEKVSNVVGGASDAVGDFAQESKLKLEIKKREDNIKSIKTKFGTEAVEAKLRGESDEAVLVQLSEALVKVQDLQTEIAGLRADIQKIKDNNNKEA